MNYHQKRDEEDEAFERWRKYIHSIAQLVMGCGIILSFIDIIWAVNSIFRDMPKYPPLLDSYSDVGLTIVVTAVAIWVVGKTGGSFKE
ncbi:hypothetical protein FIM04_04060 [SAR202 cluster bacterium AC-409-J13_OGT_754m]|nr:hypothetical protein [SAR202 cluster bacterium AC-409-J13_OGT_754m]